MNGATHFIEQYRYPERSPLQVLHSAEPLPINVLPLSLQRTSASGLITVAVWKIKFKPGYPVSVLLAENDKELDTVIIKQG